MKTIVINQSAAVKFDDETKQLDIAPNDREGIRRVILLDEDTHILYTDSKIKYETDAKAGQILVLFYNSICTYDLNVVPLVVIDSPEWKNNLELLREYDQKQKEEWALRKMKDAEAEGCDNAR